MNSTSKLRGLKETHPEITKVAFTMSIQVTSRVMGNDNKKRLLLSHPTTRDVTKVLSALGPDQLVARPGLSPAHISPANPHSFVPAQRKPNWPDTHRTSHIVTSSLYAP
ncbi:hypothetical protein ACLOJK_010935 [Asimina triloba]